MGKNSRTHGPLTAIAAGAAASLVLAGAQSAYAQAGIGVQQNTTVTGTIGSNKGDAGTGAVACPAGTIMTGIYHRDKGTGGTTVTVGMTVAVGVYCSSISTDGSTVTMTQTTPNGTPAAVRGVYGNGLTPQSAYCSNNRVGLSFYGYDRNTSNAPWSSSIGMNCSTISVGGITNWFTVSQIPIQSIAVGVNETNAVHVLRGPFCGTNLTGPLVTGLFAQAGGEGYDGINVYCGRLIQARHSAILTFSDFAWDQTRSATGWRVNLTQNNATMSSGSMTGAGRVPYATSGDNGNGYNAASEIYVIPNPNGSGRSPYGAAVSNRPAAFAAAAYNNAYITTGTCVDGVRHGDQVDGSCVLNVEGRPDLRVQITSPATTYTTYGQNQSVTVTVSNIGPGATTAGDTFRVRMTLPATWNASSLPSGCAMSGTTQVVCTLGALAASSSPATVGGTQSFTFNVAPASPTASGSFTMPAQLDTSVPHGDGNLGNDDFNSSNDSANATLVLSLNATLRLSKTWAGANVGDSATLQAASSTTPSATHSSTATTASQTTTGTAVQAPIGAQFTLSETLAGTNVGGYNASNWSCTGGSLSGSVLTINAADSGTLVTCTITNTRKRADVAVQKTSNVSTIRSGQDIVWTITARNNGPDVATGVVLTDTPASGQDCTLPPPPPTCTASGGATCPSGITAAGLASGVTIASLPVNGQLVITLTCRVTASGL